MIGNTNSLKKERPEVNFDYIRGKRYIVEIKEEDFGRVYYSRRINSLATAEGVRNHYDNLRGYVSRLFDTKTGGVF